MTQERVEPEVKTSLLSDIRILAEVAKDNIVIHPFKLENLGSVSYDVSLGPHFFREQHPQVPQTFFNPYSKQHVKRIWGEPQIATKAAELMVLLPNEADWEGIPSEGLVILIEPGETILAHTQEFIGGRNGFLGEMKARSSLDRIFIDACKSAGLGDVGFINRWTMEITNFSKRYTIPLVVGRRYAQILFFEVGPTLKEYHQDGKYQSGQILEELIKSWIPQDMLPKLYLDREVTEE